MAGTIFQDSKLPLTIWFLAMWQVTARQTESRLGTRRFRLRFPHFAIMSNTAQLQAEAQKFRDDFQRLRDSVGRVIVGQQRVVDGVLTAIVAGGNVLLEGVPGLGKTELVKTLARALYLDFRRINSRPTSCRPTSSAPR